MIAKRSRARLLAVACLLLATGCNRPAAPSGAPSSEKPRAEADLSRTSITAAARDSLGIQTKPVRVETVQEHRTLSGWVMPRPGSEVTITAPVGGYVRAPAPPAELPAPGLPVAKDQVLFRLEPVLSPLEQTQLQALRRGYENDLAKAVEDVDVAKNELKRVEELYKKQLRFERDLEQARAQLKKFQEDLAAAEDKLKVIATPGTAKGTFQPAPISLKAPRAGIALAVNASPGQFVAAAAPLAAIADMARPWVRVPISEADLPRVDRGRAAQVTIIPEAPGERGGKPAAPLQMKAEPVGLVPQVDPVKHTADLIYELKAPSEHATLAKDQMLLVQVPVGARAEEAIVPYAAVVFDAYGGSWVYVDRTAKDAKDCVYERVRIELGPPLGTDVAVRPALKAGEPVVSEGAAALFSREFHRPPVPVPEAPKGK